MAKQLQSIFEYQTMIKIPTEMAASNASMYDGHLLPLSPHASASLGGRSQYHRRSIRSVTVTKTYSANSIDVSIVPMETALPPETLG